MNQKSRTSRAASPGRVGWIAGGIVLLCVVVACIILLVLSLSTPAAKPSAAPEAAASATPVPTAPSGPVPPALHEGAAADSTAVKLDIYADYKCIWCARFDQTNADTIAAGVADKSLSVTYHPVAILGGEGSFSQAAGAFAGCLAETSPESIGAWNRAMFGAQGPDTEKDLDVPTMRGFATDAGVTDTADLEKCVSEQRYIPWIAWATDAARAGTLGDIPHPLEGTPSIYINGQQYQGSPVDAAEFAAALTKAR